MEDLDAGRILDLQGDSRLHIISGGTKVVQHSPPLKASAGLKRKCIRGIKLKEHNTFCVWYQDNAMNRHVLTLQLWTMAV